jgi:uridine phosphorylase
MVSWMNDPAELCALFEFDPEREAVFEAASTQAAVNAPGAAVGCFLPEAIAEAVREDGRELMRLPSRAPLWETSWRGQRLAVFYPAQGAPLAACVLERVIAAGCRTIVFCGGAGALVPELALGQVIVTTAAVRDEGTSFHYLPPAREIAADPAVVRALCDLCERTGVRHTAGKSWTTDGIFRETPAKVARRRAEGCITVESEAAALFAVGSFRMVRVGVMLYAGDNLSGGAWNDRGWKQAFDARRRLFELAADAAVALDATLPSSYDTRQ